MSIVEPPSPSVDTLRGLVDRYRPEDAARLRSQWDRYGADAIAWELWEAPLAVVLATPPERLARDWRERRRDAQRARLGERGYAERSRWNPSILVEALADAARQAVA